MFQHNNECNTLLSLLRLGFCLLAVLIAAPALAVELNFTSGGTAPWFSQSLITHDGVDALQSGAISHSQSSWQETTVTGPGAVRFWWKVSSESCCDALAFSIDGTSQSNIRGEIDWQKKAFAIPTGSHTLRWTYSTDGSVLTGSNAGWADEITFEAGSNIDVTPPATTASPAGGTVAAAQIVTLSANEPATIYYTTNGSEPTTSSDQYTFPLTISGTTTLKFFAMDTAGNYELTKTVTYTFDTTPPNTGTSLNAGTYSGARNVSLYCSDNGMGCATTYYCLGTDCTPTTTYSSTIAIIASTDLRYYSVDRGGNNETVKTSTYTILPDTTPPTTTPGYASGTYGPIYAYLSCSDGAGSGCTSTHYCLGAGCTPATTYSSSIHITASTDFRFYSQDRSGNSEAVKTVSYVIDQTPPVTTANPPGGSFELAPQITLACSDGTGTGCVITYYCTGTNCTPATLYSAPIPINDTTVLRYYSTDSAHNSETIVTQSYTRSSQPKTITVPDMRSTIQSAIDDAYNGDTVLVSPGIYQENINFKGKQITVTSSGGAETTIIDGNKAGSVVSFKSGESSTSVLNGFTIQNGMSSIYNEGGGGIAISGSSPRVTNNRVIDNRACDGPGILVSMGSPLIQGNLISNNNRDGCTGGAGGGGILIKSSSNAQILDNTVSNNSIYGGYGGGIVVTTSDTAIIRGNRISNNRAWGISPCAKGGGIYLGASNNVQVTQNVIDGNYAECGGGLSLSNGSDPRNSYISNNTIVDNDSPTGSGVHSYNLDANDYIINNIIVGKPGQNAIYCESSAGSIIPQTKNNLVYSPTGSAYAGICTDQNGINGNITADPLLSGPTFGYFGLRPGSPAIDAGDNTVPSLPDTDFGGMKRVIDGNNDGTAIVDIGAYEFDPTRPVATLQGIPTGFLTANTLDITVGGTDVVSYRYLLDGGTFSDTDIAVATPIHLTNLTNGQHSIVVVGKNALGIEQLLSSATVATWVVDTETTNLTFTYGGTAPWFVQPLVSHDGIAYQSGAITNNQTSWMETTVTGPGVIRFWWKVSSHRYYNPLTFSIDGTSQASISDEVEWQNKAYAIPAGSHTLRWTYAVGTYITVSPNAGWVDQIVFEQGSNLDITPPVTSATPAAGMYASSQNVALACGDTGGSGCASTYYCLGSGCNPTILYNGPISISSATDLRFYSTDAAGNSEIVKTATYTFDTIPPSTYTSLSAGTYSGARDVSLYCSDSGMGCATTYFCLGSGCTPTTLYSSAIAITASTDLRYYSVDRGGNNETVKTSKYTITPDSTPPTTTNSYPSGTYRPLHVYLSCSDGVGSGCANTYYCLGANCTPTTPFGSSISIATSTNLRFYSVDYSGNSEAVNTLSYTIDATPPATIPSVVGGIYTTPQNVTLSCSDGTGSGCITTYYCLGKGCSPNTQYTGPISITSSTYLNYYSLDVVYNQETTKTARYTILTAPPVTVNVPADRTTIQAAIDAANDGDTVLVAPGTYVENINFKGKAITVASSGGPNTTVIDGNHAGPVVSFNTGEELTTVLNGFAIRNGNAGSTSPNNGNGGGLYISASPTIINNTITANTASWGGGIYVSSGSPLVQGNIITHNTGSIYGGGVSISGAVAAQIIGNTISNNTSLDGGGISMWAAGTPTIRGNTIKNNTASVSGGGISMINGSDADIVQNVLANNSANSGSAVYWLTPFGNRGPYLVNNTIVDSDGSHGSVVYADGYDAGALLVNNIVAAAGSRNAVYCGNSNDINPPHFSHNAVFSSAGLAYGGSCIDQDGSSGNITAETRLRGAVFGYIGLQPVSPAIDSGDNSAPGLPATDLNGAPRLIDGTGQGSARVDIGAYEYDPTEPRVVLTDAPLVATRETAASITVSGSGIISFRYSLDGGPFTTVGTPVTTPIILSDLAGGIHAVAVIGKTLTREQLISFATVAEWMIDTIPPVTTAAPAGGSYTEPQNVTLTCNDNGGSGCAGTFYCLGSDCTPTTPYTGPIAVTTSTGLRFYSLDAFGYQETIKTASYTFVGTISGRVSDGVTGNGVQGLSVTVYNAATGAVAGYGYTDSSGNYQIVALASGSYKLLFSASGYVEQWYSGKADRSAANTVTVSAPNATSGIDVIMVRGGSITGIVSGIDTGAGIQNVSVSVYNAISGALVSYGYTDVSGAYTISGLAPGDYKLSFNSQSSSGYLVQWYSNKADFASATPVTVTSNITTSGVSVGLQRGGSITGTVTDSFSGAAIEGVYVTAVDAVSGAWINSGSTDSSGVYTINGLAGRYKLQFTSTGYVKQWYGGTANQAAATIVTVSAPNTTTGINMVLVRGARITGTVTDSSTGNGIPGANVYAYNTAGSWVSVGYADNSGSYSIIGLASGAYKLRFSAAGYVDKWSGGTADIGSADVVAVTAPDSIGGMNMALVKGAVISGTVTAKDTGAGIQNVYVTAYNAVSGSWSGCDYTDGNGGYTITGLASGSYKLQFSSSSSTGYISQWYSNKEQQSTATAVEVVVPNTVGGINATLEKGGVITGTVTDKDSGYPIQNVYVTAYSAATAEWISSGYTDSSGAYRLIGLASGSYKLSFIANDYITRWFDGQANQSTATAVPITAPDTTANVNAVLGKAGSISGTITDSNNGAGIAGTYLYLVDSRTGDWVASTSSDSDGRYTITGLASGSYRLRIEPSSGSGYPGVWYGGQDDYLCAASLTVTAPNATTGIDAQLAPGGSISGRVSDAATGAGISGVYIFLANTSTQAGPVRSSLTADPSGAYTIAGLPSGEYSLTFSAPDYIRTTSPTLVTVTAPAAISAVDVSLVRGGGISGRISDSTTGEGVGEIMVDAVDIQTRVRIGSAVSDYAGNYAITGLPSGSYAVYYDGRSAHSPYGTGWKTIPTVAAGTTTTHQDSAVAAAEVESVSIGVTVTMPPPRYPQPFPVPLPILLPVDIPSSAQSIPVVIPAITSGMDMVLDRTGAISGRVTDISTGTPLGRILVSAYDSVSGARVGSTITNMASMDGSYTISGLPSGSYRIQFTSPSSADGGYLSAWYGGGTDAAAATAVVVQAPQTTFGINARLAKAGGISGRISVNSCPGPRFVNIKAYDAASGALVGQTTIGTASTDRFTIGALPGGSYKLAITPIGAGFVHQWYLNKMDMTSAGQVAVSAGSITGITDVSLAAGGGSISGKVNGNSACTSLPADIKLYDWASGGLVAEGRTSSDGNYQLGGLPDASYKILFTLNQLDYWYRSADETAQATAVIVSGGLAVTGIDLTTACPPDGICGRDNGQVLSQAAPVSLCAKGNPSEVSGSGHPWIWTCQGDAGTEPASCSASIRTYLLSLSVPAGGGKGNIRADVVSNDETPVALFCPASFCSALYDFGRTVRLTAEPDSFSLFSSWGGACSADPCEVTMTAPMAVSAYFTRPYSFKNVSIGLLDNSLASLFSASNPGNEIRMLATELAIGSLTLDKGVALSGGWKGLYQAQDTNPTTLDGTITVKAADSTINDTTVKGGLFIQGGSLRVNRVLLSP